MVGSIEEDKNGNLWLGTNAGLVKLGAQSPGRDAVVRVYTEVDGLQGNFSFPGLLAAAMANCFWRLQGI